MPIAAEFVEPFILVYGAFKSSVDNLIPIMCFLLKKKLNLWYMMLYSHKNDYFYQKQNSGLHKNMLMN